MLSRAEKAAIRASWELLLPVADATMDLFYQRLVQQDGKLWPKSHAELAQRKKELLGLFAFAVATLDWDDRAWRDDVEDEQDLFVALLGLGKRNTPLARLILEHYAAVGEALVGSLAFTLGKRFDAPTKAAWSRLYALLANALRLGQLASRVHAVPDASAAPRSVLGSMSLRRGVAS
jgi:hemoglobin-like flavoprotein